MMTLRDLTRQLFSEDEMDQYLEIIARESDRGAAVMAAALVERALEDKIRSRLHDPGKKIADAWFEGNDAPFRTFSAKISLSRGLTIIDGDVEKMLVVIKNVRNAFAHAMVQFDFTHPAVTAEIMALLPNVAADRNLAARTIFISSCLTLGRLLGMTALLHSDLGRETAASQSGQQEPLGPRVSG